MLGDTDMTEAAAHVALHDDRETVIHDAVVTARRAVGADSAMAAVANDAGSYEMRVSDFVREPRFREMVIRRGLGLAARCSPRGAAAASMTTRRSPRSAPTSSRLSLSRICTASAARSRTVALTQRERKVLGLLAEGCSNRLIAERLFIAETTGKGYVTSLLDKLETRSRLQAVVRANEHGLQ